MRTAWLFILLPIFTSAQQSRFIHPTTLGAKFSLFDFANQQAFGKLSNMDPGIGFGLVKGIYNHLDWTLSLEGSFLDSARDVKTSEKILLLELGVSLRARMIGRDSRVNPFLSLGVGGSKYGKYFSFNVPAGVGLQVRMFQGAYCVIEAQYRTNFPSAINSHYYYNLGFSGTLNTRRSKSSTATSIPVTIPEVTEIVRDSDQDGVPDSTDACPSVAGMLLFSGCPDRDNDSIPDKDDKCPNSPGLNRYLGCPIPDTDLDGINDEKDSCIAAPGVPTLNGCPILDSDNDGVPNDSDKCPEIAGDSLQSGCPPINSLLQQSVSRAAKNILFETGSFRLNSSSYKYLDEVVTVLRNDPLLKLGIEGHTDNTNDSVSNQILSERRAQAVLNYISKQGIEASRLNSIGYGESKPLADNNTFSGRRENRRVEMKLRY